MKMRLGKKHLAFTLVELMIVVGILALLLTLALPRLTDYGAKARIRVFEANYRAIAADLTAAHSAGNAKTTEIEKVRNKANNYKDRPQGAVYTIDLNGMDYVAKLGDYELRFDIKSGTTVSTQAPEGAAYLSP